MAQKTDRDKQRQKRRMADLVRSGLTIRQAADKLGVSYGAVWRACIELEVTPRPASQRGGVSPTFRILAALINTSTPQYQIATQEDVTHQRVNQIAIEARRAGIKLHPDRKLQKTSRPELTVPEPKTGRSRKKSG